LPIFQHEFDADIGSGTFDLETYQYEITRSNHPVNQWLDDFSAQQLNAHMLRRIVIGGCLALGLLVGILVFRESGDDSRAYAAESLLIVRPFNNALLGRAFEREVRRSSPGITRLGFQLLNCTITTSNGTTRQTNGVVRLVAAGGTAADAKRLANDASDGVGAILRQQYGISTTPIGQAHSAPSSAFREPFRLRFGTTAPGYFPAAGRVFFPGAAISMDPGNGWMRSYDLLYKGVGREPEPVLELIGKGKFNGGFIRAFPLRPEVTNVQSAIAELRSGAQRQQGFIESSWKEEPSETEDGLQGVHTSFTQQYPSPFQGGVVLMSITTRDYLVTNAQSRRVCIQYISVSSSNARPGETISAMESEQAQRMIRSTSRVE
jgi:hypothetical protein